MDINCLKFIADSSDLSSYLKDKTGFNSKEVGNSIILSTKQRGELFVIPFHGKYMEVPKPKRGATELKERILVKNAVKEWNDEHPDEEGKGRVPKSDKDKFFKDLYDSYKKAIENGNSLFVSTGYSVLNSTVVEKGDFYDWSVTVWGEPGQGKSGKSTTFNQLISDLDKAIDEL